MTHADDPNARQPVTIPLKVGALRGDAELPVAMTKRSGESDLAAAVRTIEYETGGMLAWPVRHALCETEGDRVVGDVYQLQLGRPFDGMLAAEAEVELYLPRSSAVSLAEARQHGEAAELRAINDARRARVRQSASRHDRGATR